MVFKRAHSKNWWYKFKWKGEPVRESTRQTNKRIAEQIESAHKTKLAKGEVGIVERPAALTLSEFATDKFLPFVRVEKASKPATVDFYSRRVASLLKDKTLKAVRLDKIEVEHVTAFKSKRRGAGQSVSTVNRDLATLRRMLYLAVEQNVLAAMPVGITLLPGENRREYVLTATDEPLYLAACSPLLYAVATIILDCGFRPDEVHGLRWNQNIRSGAIEVHTGKGDGSRRRIEVTDRVDKLLGSMKRTSEWVFSAPTKSGHINVDSYKGHHAKAIKESGVATFVPYSLRHTCLTRWAVAGMDAPALQYLAGHKNIATTMKYIHLAQTDIQSRLAEIRRRMKLGVVPVRGTGTKTSD